MRSMLRSGSATRIVLLALFALSILPPRPAAAAVSHLRVRPTAFSPNGDNLRDLAMVRWDVVADPAACILLTFQKGTDRIQFDLGPRAVGPDSLAWDGLDSLAAVMPDGLYSVILEERDDTCGVVRSVGSVTLTLDVTAPPIPTYDTPDTLVTKPAFKIQGEAAGADSVALFLGGVPVDTVQTTGVAPDLSYLFDVVLTEGHNSYSVQAWDRAGNFSPQATARDYVYQNTPDIGPVSVVPLAFSPNADGRSDTTR